MIGTNQRKSVRGAGKHAVLCMAWSETPLQGGALGPRPKCECPCEFWGKRIPGGGTAGPKFCVGYQLGGLEEKRKWGGWSIVGSLMRSERSWGALRKGIAGHEKELGVEPVACPSAHNLAFPQRWRLPGLSLSRLSLLPGSPHPGRFTLTVSGMGPSAPAQGWCTEPKETHHTGCLVLGRFYEAHILPAASSVTVPRLGTKRACPPPALRASGELATWSQRTLSTAASHSAKGKRPHGWPNHQWGCSAHSPVRHLRKGSGLGKTRNTFGPQCLILKPLCILREI